MHLPFGFAMFCLARIWFLQIARSIYLFFGSYGFRARILVTENTPKTGTTLEGPGRDPSGALDLGPCCAWKVDARHDLLDGMPEGPYGCF